jgi:hypothetical protein
MGAVMPNEFKKSLQSLLLSDPMQSKLRQSIVEQEKVLIEAMKIAASDDIEAAPPQAVDVKIVAFINAMTPEERLAYVKTGDLPQAVFTRVNAKLEEGR